MSAAVPQSTVRAPARAEQDASSPQARGAGHSDAASPRRSSRLQAQEQRQPSNSCPNLQRPSTSPWPQRVHGRADFFPGQHVRVNPRAVVDGASYAIVVSFDESDETRVWVKWIEGRAKFPVSVHDICPIFDMLKRKRKFAFGDDSPTRTTKKKRVLKFKLPAGKKKHFFICHHQSSGGDQAHILSELLTQMGYSVWYDNSVEPDERNIRGMRKGVRESACVLIFWSGREEVDRVPNPHGDYEGTFTRWYCHEEMTEAHRARVPFIGVMESMVEHGKPDKGLEQQRARTARDGGPVSLFVEQNLRLLDEVCFIPFRRQVHEVDAMLNTLEDLAVRAKPQPVMGEEARDHVDDDSSLGEV
jgi:hypothetical protein